MAINNSPDFHFIAIGGVGQSALAKILLCLGYSVSGSDMQNSKYIKLVEDLGAKVYIGHNKENIKGSPRVVISSAIKEDNPELVAAKEKGLEIMHRSDCLKYISELFPLFIGLSGTHGKTTTSGLLSYVLEKLNKNPSYAIGGIIPELNINAKADKNSKYFIAELDESDGTIVKYHPEIVVINNLEADHLDYYKNGLSDILNTFKTVLDNSKNVFVNVDNEGVKELIKKNPNKNYISYGIKNSAFYQAKNIEYKDLGSSFDIYKDNKFLVHINLIIPGVHNIYNALAIASVLDYLNIQGYEKHFETFSGMGRRFQLVADINDIKIIDDYAHHPAEIQSTLSSVKNLKRNKIAIFQPHRYTRLKGLWNEFLDSFNTIDELYVLDTFSAGDKFDEQYNSKNFADEIIKKGIKTKYIKGNIKEAAEQIAPLLNKGDIVLTLGAGDITKIGGVINDLLSK
ncbi:UDP-N-acetylmuramate--L-alanine ligase [bacterium]|nr:UDP-N-acetylmuramate--L-alanine ligase [bacterium]